MDGLVRGFRLWMGCACLFAAWLVCDAVALPTATLGEVVKACGEAIAAGTAVLPEADPCVGPVRESAGKWHRQELTAALAVARRPQLCAIRTAAIPDERLRRMFADWGARQVRHGGGRIPAHLGVALFLRKEVGCS